jgi:S1-C subfamily serine protease
MHSMVSRGWTSSSRTVVTLCDPNPVEYSLLEVHMMTEKGSSGAPLVDEKGEVIGMIHGGFGGSHSYFVDARFLRAWELPADHLD